MVPMNRSTVYTLIEKTCWGLMVPGFEASRVTGSKNGQFQGWRAPVQGWMVPKHV